MEGCERQQDCEHHRGWNIELNKCQNEQPKPIPQSQQGVVMVLEGVLGSHALLTK